MTLRLPSPSSHYDPRAEAQLRRALMDADRENFKRGSDVEVETSRIIIRSPNGTRWALTVSDSGVVGASAL